MEKMTICRLMGVAEELEITLEAEAQQEYTTDSDKRFLLASAKAARGFFHSMNQERSEANATAYLAVLKALWNTALPYDFDEQFEL